MRRLLVPLLLLGASSLLHSSILHPGIGLLGQPCDPNPDNPSCSVVNSTCSGGKCVCARGFSDSKSGLCLPITFSSSSLNASTQVTKFCKPACHATTEICYQGNCVCAGGHIRMQNNCQPVALLLKSAAPAAGDVRRSPTYGQSSQGSSSYVNRPYPGSGQLRSPANSVQAVPPDSVCGSDADCAGYPLAFCDGVCRCVAGALNAGSTCISNGNSISVSGTCPPGQSYVTEAGSCMTTAVPGEPCQYSQQCSATEPGAFCLRLKCECVYGMKQSGSGCTFADSNCAKRGFIWIPELGECKEVIPPGGRGCSHNLQCSSSFPGSTCFLQTCACPSSHPVAIDGTCGRNCTAGLTYSGVTGQCLPTVQPGDQCLYSSQCHAVHPGIGCDRGRCRCPRDEVFTGNGCSITCPSGYRVNSRGICSPGCRSNQVEHEGECLDASVAGQACVVNAQCTGGSSCQDSLCKCTRGMTAKGGICVAIESAPLGSCANGEICGGGSFCSNGNCTCPVGRQVLNGRCVTPITVSPGANCLRVGVVCGGNSFCVRGICQCRAGQQPFDGVCMHELTAEAGASCARGETCTGGTMCNAISRVCECANSMEMAIGSRCVQRLQSHPGYPCGNGEVCVGGSMCHRGKCECPDGSQQQGKQCLTMVYSRPGESCGNGEICEGGSNCLPTINRCTCPMGMAIVFGQCNRVVDVQPGGECGSAAIRCTGGSFCNTNGRCTCPEGTHHEGGYCRPAPVPLSITEPAPLTSNSIIAPGDECNAMSRCGSGTICLRGICQCPEGLTPDGRCMPTTTTEASTSHSSTRSRPMTSAATNPPTLMTSTTTSSRAGARRMESAGGACSPSDLCTGRSFCAHGVCRCAAPLIARAGSCTPTASSQVASSSSTIGSRCSTTSDCPSSSVCNGGYCACPPGTTRASATSCTPITTTTSTTTARTTTTTAAAAAATTAQPTGRRCLAANQCPSGADCIQGECKCTQGLTLSRFGFCIPVTYAGPGEPCPQGTQCRGGATCAYGNCVCPPEHDVRDGKCVPRDDINDVTNRRRRLTKDILHFVPHSNGVDRQRDFVKGTIKKHRDDKFLAPGESCDESVFCDLNAFCTEERLCRCSPTFVQAGRQCIPRDYVSSRIVVPGASCNPSDFCDGGAVCVYGMCLCAEGGYNPSPVGVCAPTKVGPGEGCAEGERCSRGSLCVGGLCVCPVETEERHGKCIPRTTSEKLTFQKIAKAPGLPCASNPIICSGGSLCIMGTCTCPTGTTNVGGTCVDSSSGAYAVPGASCSAGQTCSGNSICVASFCVCPGGEKIRDGQCVSVDSQAAPGQQCDAAITVCSGNSVCTNNVCTCPQNMVALNGQCANVLAQVNVGGGSSSSCPSPCPPNSYCQSGACVCQMGYSYQQGQGCISSSPLTFQTPSPYTYVNPSSGLQPIVSGGGNYVSGGGSYVSGGSYGQLQPAGSYCGSTAQCGAYSICQENVCRCIPGYASYSTTGGCTSMTDSNSMTIDGTIYVPAGSMGFDESNSIIGPITNTGSGFNTNGLGNGIRNANLGAPGQECDFLTTPSCRGGSFCSNSRCVCGNGLVIGHESCVPYSGDANPGDPCGNAGVVCRGGSTCIAQTCTCDVGFAAQGSICVGIGGGGLNPVDPNLITTLRPGEQCDPSCDYSPCPAKCGYGSVCVDTLCNCALGTQNMGGFCGANDPPVIGTLPQFSTTTVTTMVTARPGDRCDVRIICNGGSQCILGICQCPQGYVPSGDRSSCVLASLLGNGNTNPIGSPILPQQFSSYSKLGTACLTTADCPESASCVDRVCSCNADSRMTEGKCVVNVMMKNEAMLFPGSRCLSSLTCLKGAHCFLGYCVCLQDTTTNATGYCEQRNKIDVLPRALPGAQCSNGERCEGGSACVSGYCICQGEERADSEGVCRGEGAAGSRLGSVCSTSTDCSLLPHSICHSGVCLCEEGFERVNENCLKVAALPLKTFSKKITKCSSYKDCAMPRVCGPRKSCECPFTMAETETGECVFRSTLASPGAPCPSGDECGAGSHCLQGTCVCPQGLQLTNEQCLPYPNAPGGTCEQSPECTGGSSCMGGTCLCPSGHTKPGEACRVRRSGEGLSLSPPSTYSSPSNTYTLHYDARPGNGLSPCPADATCSLPECACSSSGTAPPASLLPSQTPQMIVITFEGAVTDRTTRIYKSLFSGRLRSHDCPLRATFFVSHEYTNYDQVQWLAARGNEIAVAGMGSTSLSSRSEDRWRAELQGMRMALAEFSKIEVESIRGVRAPGMKTGGDSHFSVLAAWNFTYDHSIAPDGGPFWPQTLDHTLPFLCTDGSCPTKAFKGVWEAPVNRIITTDGRSVARLREAIRSTDTRDSVADLLRRNLQRNYQGSRAPLVLSLDADFMFALPQNEAVNGLIDFLEESLAKEDVYPVTVSQMISWMKSPTSLDRLAKFKPFHCPRRANDHVQPCETPSTCSFVTPQGSRSFRVCGSCPRDYPNIDDPLGKGRR
ncbi:hypothetical protein PRIPAC_74216 [Pristionchus pacificus]|nr:hypothetical protein PRIPAC_74216 [Pristionchus pacificus]